jgi:hypothetical protein
LKSDEEYFDELRDELVGKPSFGLPLFNRIHEEEAQLPPHFVFNIGHGTVARDVLVDTAVD